MKTDYPGLDYSHGKANIDPKTKIHFGVIPLNACGEFTIDEFDAVYADPCCPKCGNSDLNSTETVKRDYLCTTCNEEFNSEACFNDNPTHWELNTHEYLARFGEDNDIFIIKSDYYTYAQFCSPCAPGAGYLLNHCESGPKTYCLSHDWFENNVAPYPVYSVKTGELIQPE